LFPNNINTFIDLFAGSATVSMNVQAQSYLVNDINENLYKLYAMFKTFSDNEIISHIEYRINEYDLAKERTSHKQFNDDRVERYKAAYMKLRQDYNASDIRDVLDFYTLMFYSFSQQFRFNNKGDFNMPCGNDCFSEKNKEYIRFGCDFFQRDNVKISNGDFKKLNVEELNENDFVYLDPPYLNATATYNENNGWNERDENDLYQLCEYLNRYGIKFAMSNVFENKGIKNENLIAWCNNNQFNIYTFDKFSYTACGKGNSNAKEVLITNY
jgi:DNA adenine methylase Dam